MRLPGLLLNCLHQSINRIRLASTDIDLSSFTIGRKKRSVLFFCFGCSVLFFVLVVLFLFIFLFSFQFCLFYSLICFVCFFVCFFFAMHNKSLDTYRDQSPNEGRCQNAHRLSTAANCEKNIFDCVFFLGMSCNRQTASSRYITLSVEIRIKVHIVILGRLAGNYIAVIVCVGRRHNDMATIC